MGSIYLVDERVVPGKSNVNNLQRHIARYNLVLSDAKDKSVLDLACGTGYGSFLLDMVADSIEGVDISRDAIEFAEKFYHSSTLSFKQADILDYQHDEVDLIISFETIEHIKDLDRLESKFFSLLKTGGKIIYSVPLYENYENPHHAHKFEFESGLKLFPKFTTINHCIQSGVNFSLIDNKKPFTYLIVVKKK